MINCVMFDEGGIDGVALHERDGVAREEVPKRRRMITDGMMQWLIAKAKHEGRDSAT